MNSFLPANIGTFVTPAHVHGADPGGDVPRACSAAMVVQKIFFTIAGTFVYLYLFLSVPGSFDLQLGSDRREPVAGRSDHRRRGSRCS